MFAFTGTPSHSTGSHITTFVGETAYLQCGNAETVINQVDWIHQPSSDDRDYFIVSAGHLTNGNFEGRLNISGTTLIINNVERGDSGVYSCVEDARVRRRHRVDLIVQGYSTKLLMIYQR